MTMKANPAVVGGFVIGAIGLLILSLIVLGSGRFFKNDMRLMAVFPGTVKGLHVGSPVLFRGVNIGSVARIHIYHDQQKKQSLVPVYIDLKQEVLELMNQASEDTKFTKNQAREFMQVMINSGLHARLILESLVSGRQMVEFEFDPDIPIHLTGIDNRYVEIPTVESDLNQLQNLFKSLPITELTENLVVTVTKLNKVFADKEAREVFRSINSTILGSRELIDNLNEQLVPLSMSAQDSLNDLQTLLKDSNTQLSATLTELITLSKNLNEQLTLLTKSATHTFEQSDQAFSNINTMVDREGVFRYKLEQSLDELSRAAKSFRGFTEYLERHPEAIIKGKQY